MMASRGRDILLQLTDEGEGFLSGAAGQTSFEPAWLYRNLLNRKRRYRSTNHWPFRINRVVTTAISPFRTAKILLT